MKDSVIVGKFLEQIRMATQSGLKGKDDCIDNISQLAYLKPWKPSAGAAPAITRDVMWDDEQQDEVNPLSSYIV